MLRLADDGCGRRDPGEREFSGVEVGDEGRKASAGAARSEERQVVLPPLISLGCETYL